MYILPDDVLNKLICSVCFQYLSVKPVKIYRNKVFNIKCGRCSEDKDDGIVSLYDSVIGNGLFPCINRYEGCTQLLNYSEVAIHEEECKSSHYNCPICESDFTSYHFVRHYEKDHPEAVLEKPVLLLTNEKEYEKYYMYKENNFVFIFYVRCNLGDSCFYVNAACVGPPERVNKIKQYLKCYLGDTTNSDKLFLETEERYCSLVENNAESFRLSLNAANSIIKISFILDKTAVNFVNYRINNQIRTTINISSSNTFVRLDEPPKLYLNEKFRNTLTNIRFNPSSFEVEIMREYNRRGYYVKLPRSCNFCENDFSNFESIIIFRCSTCYSTYFKDTNYCQTCYSIKSICHKHSEIVKLELDTLLTSCYSFLQFYCKWNCGSAFSSSNLGIHLDICKKNIYGQVSPRTFIANTFNLSAISEKSHLISRSNLFSFREYGFQNGEKIFVITRNNFKFVLHSKYEDNVFHFWVSHDYPEDYCDNIEFKIREKSYVNNLKYINTLLLDNRNNNIIDNIWGFAVVLNKK